MLLRGSKPSTEPKIHPKIKFLLQEFDSFSLKEKAETLNYIVRDYKGIVTFAQMSEIEKRTWAHNFGGLAKEYFEDPNITK